MLQVVADDMIPGLEVLLGDKVCLKRVAGRAISASDVKDADALLVRSVTRVDGKLLHGSRIQFVGTATIGIDHVDHKWLSEQGIGFASAAGCNAAAVAQYVLSAIAHWCLIRGRNLESIRVGIVGAGHVGSYLARYLDALNVGYRLCDPPLVEMGDRRTLVSLDKIFDCDVVTLHVPLSKDGKHPTYQMIGAEQLSRLCAGQLLINSARGDVMAYAALHEYLLTDKRADLVLDVYPQEPDIDPQLAERVLLATPHIAGHTLEGKLRGSLMIARSLAQFFSFDLKLDEQTFFPAKTLIGKVSSAKEQGLLQLYDIRRDSVCFKKALVGSQNVAQVFDAMRKNYIEQITGGRRRDYPMLEAHCDSEWWSKLKPL